MSVEQIEHMHDSWTVLSPIAHLELSEAVNYEFRVDRVTFVATAKLPGRRRRLGLPRRLSQMRAVGRGVQTRILDQSPTVAVIRMTGKPRDCQREVVTLLRDELAILAASQLGYAKRRQCAAPSIWGERPTARQSLLWVGRSGPFLQTNRVYGPCLDLRIDADWLRFQRGAFFAALVKLLQGAGGIVSSWREDLRKAAVLIGLGQMADTVPDAFLPNMIALEVLLTEQPDKVVSELPSRAEALLGWSTNWTQDRFEERIKRVYQRRCRMVHRGDREAATREDLFFTDDLLLCLLANLVSHPTLFGSKDAIAEFARRVEAESLLGVQPAVRPRSLRVFRRSYSDRDYDIY